MTTGIRNKRITAVIAAGLSLLLLTSGCASSTHDSVASSVPSPAAGSEPTAETTKNDSLTLTTPDILPTEMTQKQPNSPATDVQDKEGASFVILSWDDTFRGQVDSFFKTKYPDFTYEYRTFPAGEYESKVAAMLSSGEDLPDVLLFDASYARDFIGSDALLDVGQLGISWNELAGQFPASRDFFAADDGTVKALGMIMDPIAVFYNRAVAKQYLGTDDPASVGEHFADWASFLQTSRTLNTDSGGTVKILPDSSTVQKGYLFSRQTPWITDNQVTIDAQTEGFLDFNRSLLSENLTFSDAPGSDAWLSHARDGSVLAYFTTLPVFSTKMGFAFAEDKIQIAPDANPTTGNWGICEAPADFFIDGVWIAATTANDKRATTAELFRFFTTDSESTTALAAAGMFVNQVSVMQKATADPAMANPFLLGQNPYSVLTKTINETDLTKQAERDVWIEPIFLAVAGGYAEGKIPTVGAAREVFLTDCEDLNLAS